MRLLNPGLIAIGVLSSSALAVDWNFHDAVFTVAGKGAGVRGGVQEKFYPESTLSTPVTLAAGDTLKLLFGITEGWQGKRPHQAFLTLHEPVTGLEESFPCSVRDNGKAKVEVTQKDLPYQLATSNKSLEAWIVIGSFGSAGPLRKHVFDITVQPDSASPPTAPPPAERYVRKPEIRHIFKADPRSPPRIISLFFTLAILATVPVLFGAWLMLGANLDHFGKAFNASPVAHGLFFGSIIAMEGVFFMYYTVWNLFQTLPAVAIVGVVAYVSGSRALTEVQDRRLAGER